MATGSIERYKFNGVISTDKTVMQNLETMCSAANTWLSYDVHTGKWAFIINKLEDSIASFNDSNIIGGINISSTGLNDLYNSVKVEFPHIDLNDQRDFIRDEIPTAERYAYEPPKELDIQFDILNDPVQAELIGLIELKQSRIDKVIQFNTDFCFVGLKAGDVIDITASMYGFTNKKFRIVTVVEQDTAEGAINLAITALEYDEAVYATDDLTRYDRTTSNGIASIGGIGQPGVPTVNKYELNARPRILIETLSPQGIVEYMEAWIATTEQAAFEDQYKLLSTTKAPSTQPWEYGTEVKFDVDGISKGDYHIKVRGCNSTTTGPFSDPTGVINYVPTQATDAITGNTAIKDDSGNTITGLLGSNALLALLGSLMNGGNGIGSIFDKLFGSSGLVKSVLGVDMSGGTQTMGVSRIVAFQADPIISLTGDDAWHTIHVLTYQADYTGKYTVNFNLNWGGSGNPGATGCKKLSAIQGTKNSISYDFGIWSSTGDDHVQLYEDHNITGVFEAVVGDMIAIYYSYRTNWSTPAVAILTTITLVPTGI
jgi:hypothetical protein